MIYHYLKIAFRNLIKYKTQSIVSIVGLAIGFTCFALSVLWIRYEMTYDDFHEGSERIYLAGNKFALQGDGFSYLSSSLLADYLDKNCPEVEKACHVMAGSEAEPVLYQKTEYQMMQLNVDSSFVSMFNITVLNGDNQLRLGKNQIAITDKAAKRIFGDELPIGKQITLPENDHAEMTIVAVVKSWEGHSIYPFDILLPYPDWEAHWGRQQCHTLFRVYPDTDIKALEQRLAEYKVQQDSHEQTISTPIALLSTLRSTHPQENVNVKLNHVRLFACIGVLVIICGLCNYLTMLITRIRMRKRELALRKVNGASNAGLLSLLLSELILLLVISSGIGAMLLELILPVFKRLSQIDESTSFFYGEVSLYILSLLVMTTGIAAIFVYYANKRTLLDSIRHKSNLHLSGWFYKGSILFQLFVSLSFIFCTLVMMKQLNFLLNSRELGLERHNVGVIVYASGCEKATLAQIVKQTPDIVEHMEEFYTPIPKFLYSTFRVSDWEGKSDEQQTFNMEDETINQNFADFFHIEVLEGSMLDDKDEKGAVVINEAAVKAFGWNAPIGKEINGEYRVKGVIKDIYYNAPIHPVSPAMFSLQKNNDRGHLIFKVKEGTWNKVSQNLQEEVHKVNPDAILDLINMEEAYNDYMKSEDTLSKLLSVVSLICIVIAVFGIFSLVTLSCEQRQKEIAIRKVNGASVKVILNLFFKEYLLLLVIASFIAFPLGYAIMKHWLEGYVKQTSINIWIYAGIFVAMLLIIFISIIWRVWRAARQNPAEVIKSE